MILLSLLERRIKQLLFDDVMNNVLTAFSSSYHFIADSSIQFSHQKPARIVLESHEWQCCIFTAAVLTLTVLMMWLLTLTWKVTETFNGLITQRSLVFLNEVHKCSLELIHILFKWLHTISSKDKKSSLNRKILYRNKILLRIVYTIKLPGVLLFTADIFQHDA